MADNEVDWDALTFSLTKTDFMYTSECELAETIMGSATGVKYGVLSSNSQA